MFQRYGDGGEREFCYKKHVLKWTGSLLGWSNEVKLEMTNDTNRELPRLRPNNRYIEFRKYPDDLKARVQLKSLPS